MSRIITEMECDYCGEKWKGYISFGHPENDFDHKWICEKCGKENAVQVKAWIDMSSNEPVNDTVIYQYDCTSNLKMFTDGMTAIPSDALMWNEFEDEQAAECFTGYLTLGEISDQLKETMKSDCVGIVYVWVEGPLYGVIYQYGNYNDGNWYIHGKTKGYA